MIPPFDIEGGASLALARALSVAGLAAAAGSLVYARWVAPPSLGEADRARLRHLAFWCIAGAAAGALVWMLAQARDMTGVATTADLGAAQLRDVLGATLFGKLLGTRLILLGIAAAALKARWGTVASGCACLALVLQAGLSHAFAMGHAPWLLASSALHILAAGLWLGGLPGLLILVARAGPASARLAAERFSILGLACVGTILATAALQSSVLVQDLPGLLGTAYGWVVCAKAAILAALIVLAARNRRRLTPRLPEAAASRSLLRAIVVELALGLAVLGAAGVLTSLQPAMHVQKLWPLPFVASLEAAREDPDIAREVTLAGAALIVGLSLLVGAAILRRRRMLALAMAFTACVGGAVSLPHLSPLLVPAVPTQFYRSPTGFSAVSIVRGAALYPEHCAACHGANGRGDGPLARTLPVPPADLGAPHLWMHADGELFWWLTHGIGGPEGGLVMPGFPSLSDDDRWALIDFLHARNAGATLTQAGWALPLQAPGFMADCGGADTPLTAFRGRIVLLFLAKPDRLFPPPPPGVTDILPSAAPAGSCDAGDAALRAAYAIAAPGASAVLIDAAGWLRAASTTSTLPDPALARQPLSTATPAMTMPPGMKM